MQTADQLYKTRILGGRAYHTEGYILISAPSHPKHNNDGYVFEHRLVYERHHNCCLLDWAVIHHINENRQDNRIENLEPMLRGENSRRYFFSRRDGRLAGRQCIKCGSMTTARRKSLDRIVWHFLDHDYSKPLCHNCHNKTQYHNRRIS